MKFQSAWLQLRRLLYLLFDLEIVYKQFFQGALTYFHHKYSLGKFQHLALQPLISQTKTYHTYLGCYGRPYVHDGSF